MIGLLVLTHAMATATPTATGAATASGAALLFRPEDFGCVPDGVTLCTAGVRKAFASCPASGCVVEFAGPGTYLTQAFNLTSNLELRIGRWRGPMPLHPAAARRPPPTNQKKTP